MKITTSSFVFLVLLIFQGFWVTAQEDKSYYPNPFEALLQKLNASGTIEGLIYSDFNANATQDPGEPGLGNVRVIIVDSDGNGLTTLTNADGIWSATIAEGLATLIIDSSSLPPGAEQTEGSDPSTVQVIANTTVQTETKGFTFLGDATGHLYFDTNGSGVQDTGEPDMPDVSIFITDQYGNSQTVTTDASGDWLATVTSGDIEVNIDVNDSDFPTGAPQTEGTNPSTHTIAAGQTTFTENDGFFKSGMLSGILYFDANENGIQDTNEPGIPNIPVEIETSLGEIITLVTVADGSWGARVPEGPAESTIDETVAQFPNGAIQTQGSNPTITNVQNGQTYEELDGFFGTGILTGHLYFDTNGNGVQDTGEADMPDVDVLITDQYGNSQTVVTTADGDWTADVLFGSVEANISQTDPDFPTGALQTEGSNPSSITILQGLTTFTENDGFYLSAILSGVLYEDNNGNATQDTGEPGIPDVSVQITTALDELINLTTDAAGAWSIRVPEGTTVSLIAEDDPDFPEAVLQTEGTNPTTTQVLNGQPQTEFDGFSDSGTLSGHLYFDTNGNGTQDSGEADMPNVDVLITDQYGNLQTAVTTTEGDWTAEVLIGLAEVNIDETDTDFPAGAIQTEGTNPSGHTVIQGQATFTENDGFYKSAVLSGIVYFDTNGNATQDAGESGIADVSVQITTALADVIDLVTDANGSWSSRVPEGSTQSLIDENDPDFPIGSSQTEGTNPTTTQIVNAQAAEEVDGFFDTGNLTGHLYFDTNGNAVQDDGEADMPDVDILITDQYGNVQTVVTSADGNWSADVLIGSVEVNIDETDPDFPTGAFQTEGTNPSTHLPLQGETTFTENDGFFVSGTLSGVLYNDSNGNGTQETGEPGIPEVSVQITTALADVIDLVTDANGSWSTRVPTGTTESLIDESDPDFPEAVLQTEGTNPSSTEIANGQTQEEKDGFSASGSLSGHLYFDTNGNAVQDTGEADMPDVDVLITDQYGNLQTAVTSADGNWTAEVLIGSAEVNIDETDADFPTGALQTEGTNPSTHTVLQAQETFTENDGFFISGILSGVLYNDSNANGTQDAGESGIPNVSVQITTALGDGIDLVTDAGGSWSIRVPAGSTQSLIDEADPDFPDGLLQTEGTNPSTTEIGNGQTQLERDGFSASGSLSGHLYFDTNGNAVQDTGEADMPDINVLITDQYGNVQTAVTTADGNWTAEVLIGSAEVNIDETDADFPTEALQTEGANPSTHAVLQAQETFTENDGFFISGILSGVLYNDSNANGTQDAGESGIPNVSVQITTSLADGIDLVTDASGSWSLRVPAGTTQSLIDEADPDFPDGLLQTEGTNPSTTEIGNGQTQLERDGFSASGSLSGHLYFDTNGNAVQDTGEADMPDVDVLITDQYGNVQTAVTSADGNWTAEILIGSAEVDIDETDADFPTDAFQTDGTDPSTHTVLQAQETFTENDGFFISGILSGVLYNDSNVNGTQDAGEAGIPDISVQILTTLDEVKSLITDANGAWSTRVPEGPTTSLINEIDPDFPEGFSQTEGTNPTTTEIIKGQTQTEMDGFSDSGIVTGRLYYDDNGNGNQDADEDGISNIRIFITDANGNQSEAITDFEGDWSSVVLAGETVSEIDQQDIDFPSNVSQTEGTNPTTTLVVVAESIRSDHDGFLIEELEAFNAIASQGSISENKFFRIDGIENYPQNSLQIYNRQGAKVYDVSGYDNSNVRFEGFSAGDVNMQKNKRLAPGTYFYILNYINRNGDPMKKTGYIHLN
ncbi:hypothetical protein G3567_05460 [Psychroflexus sp. YR1-1]|uniref:C-terminal domain of CHU protein family protein n=1 Tax=Psychroflexus aurantiacus TaxID=2709310 RepID=A0A6B3QZI5_9FLAO|nr:gliding motility-associated C-terminal domain-containing protein [Psychroflexus aurantiacus]NEV93599.1 hypothetical protein [Psychroflexus aurantiacus]